MIGPIVYLNGTFVPKDEAKVSVFDHGFIYGDGVFEGLQIVDGVTISPGSMIMRSIQQAGTYTALMPFQKHEDWLRTAANIRHLEQHNLKLKQLEQAISNIQKHSED